MEYISQNTLRQFLKNLNGGLLEEKNVKTIIKQLIQAVQYMHDQCVIHRDIKLENIMIDNNFQVKLIDFGFAIRIENERKLNVFCGTPSYMAPELTRRLEYFGKPADVWSLGIILYLLLCGKFPFTGKDDDELFRKIQSGNFYIPNNLSNPAIQLVKKLLRVNPNERYKAKEILEDLWFQV